MRNNKYLWENICMNIYRQMYKEASPSADFDQLMESGVTAKEDWFMNYYLSTQRQQEIIDIWCNKYKCNSYERKQVEKEIWLGSSPSGIKK